MDLRIMRCVERNKKKVKKILQKRLKCHRIERREKKVGYKIPSRYINYVNAHMAHDKKVIKEVGGFHALLSSF